MVSVLSIRNFVVDQSLGTVTIACVAITCFETFPRGLVLDEQGTIARFRTMAVHCFAFPPSPARQRVDSFPIPSMKRLELSKRCIIDRVVTPSALVSLHLLSSFVQKGSREK